MKIAPILWEMSRNTYPFNHFVVHSGQHFQDNMSLDFLDSFGIGRNKILKGEIRDDTSYPNLLMTLKDILKDFHPDFILVYGDTKTTLAGSICALEGGIPLAHIEAGLRSFDFSMPEERIRRMVDHASDLLLAPTETAMVNLEQECLLEKSQLVGNLMEEALSTTLTKDKSRVEQIDALVCTLHRPANIDNKKRLQFLLRRFERFKREILLIKHPRLEKRLREFNVSVPDNVKLKPPMDYHMFLKTVRASRGLITDSGGLQVEASLLGIPTLVVRENSEWPEFSDSGVVKLDNMLSALNSDWPPKKIVAKVDQEVPKVALKILEKIAHVI